jgi:1-acyl-sn-glycerol-3-phosphate acyltransferase
MAGYATNKSAPPGYNARGYHSRTLEKGVNPALYWVARGVLQPWLQIYLRLSRHGMEHVPKEGPVILASNHRSLLDAFVVGTLVRRPVYYVAKKEHFLHPVRGWIMSRLGGFPVDRGSGDAQAMETAREILERGDCVVIFPEGTRTRPGPLGNPHRGVGRLALQTGAPVVPIAVFGTEAVRRGWRVRPHHVSVRCGAPLRFPITAMPSPALAEDATERIWSCVVLQWDWLGGAMPERPRVAAAPTPAEAHAGGG